MARKETVDLADQMAELKKARDRERAISDRQDAPEKYDESYNKLSEKPAIIPTDRQTDGRDRQESSQQAGRTTVQSVAQMIRERVSQQSSQEVLKTVTLKMRPTQDDWIERYCFENKIRKQDLIAMAVDLFRETVEAQ